MHIVTWLRQHGIDAPLIPLAGDASLRRYFRVTQAGTHYVAMDASRLKESVPPFVRIAQTLERAGVRVPKIVAYDETYGFVLLEDLGDRMLAEMLRIDAPTYYKRALDTLVRIVKADTTALPPYDEAFLRVEMGLMEEWYCDKYLKISIDASARKMLEDAYHTIIEGVLSQPYGVFVHRDYHSRNIMLTPDNAVAVIDFQDARAGGVTYDAVSLLRDVYVDNDEATVRDLALYFRDKAGIDADDATFMYWFDMTGLQRHIKILGVFARLALRDGKRGYLEDIPQTLRYIERVCARYEALEAFGRWVVSLPSEGSCMIEKQFHPS